MIQTMRAGVSAARTIRRTALLWVVATLGLVPVAALPAAAPAPATTAAAVGAIVGIVMDRAKAPIAHATVTALKTDGSAIRATISGSDGVFSFADLSPGAWTVSAQADGYAALEAVPLQVLASRATRHDLVMGGAALAASPASPKTAAPAVAAAPPAAPAPAPAPAATAAPAPAPPATAAAAATPALTLPAALAAPPPSSGVDNFTPFAYGDFTWLNGSPRNHMPVFDTAFFTPDIRLDASYIDDFNHPRDHTIGGSTEEFRSNEFQLDQISIGGDFHYDNVRARLLTMWGLFATAIPDNDASSGSIGGVGQYNVQDAYRYVSEANAGYHFDVSHGLNVDLGIFASYIGLFSFYNYDNWTYQPSYVSSNTPWVFNGLRIQWYPTNKLKIEPWFINGWASYNKFNGKPGLGGQILWMPTENLKLVFNNYGMGTDVLANTPGNPQVSTTRIHTDDSIEYKYFQGSGKGLSMAAFSLTGDAGCEHGGGVTCSSGPQKSYFLGWMLYNRLWFDNNLYAVTIGGGSMDNPGRYLTLLPPINGATGSTGSPYFTENPGQKLYQWDGTVNFQYMPKEWITWWSELGFRHSDVPYFSGQGGITPPGGNNGSPQDYVCNSGSSAGTNNLQQASANCGESGVWFPDLRKREAMWSFGVLVKF